jgi:hypothetical protein
MFLNLAEMLLNSLDCPLAILSSFFARSISALLPIPKSCNFFSASSTSLIKSKRIALTPFAFALILLLSCFAPSSATFKASFHSFSRLEVFFLISSLLSVALALLNTR